MTDFIAYHNHTSVDDQNHFDLLFPQDYRIITLSVYSACGESGMAGPNPQSEATHEETAKIAALIQDLCNAADEPATDDRPGDRGFLLPFRMDNP